MAAPRATQFIALRNVARGPQQVRHLHMTGPAYHSPFLNTERSIRNLPQDTAALRAECKRRKLEESGSKSDLVARLNAHELSQSRAFSTASERRPTIEQSTNASKPATRHFNTSRELKAVNDSSTLDFAYFPEILSPSNIDVYSQASMRMLPTEDSYRTPSDAIEPAVMKPEIFHTSADAVVMPLSEMTDGHAMGIDFHAMADRVAVNLQRIRTPVVNQAGMAKRVFDDFLDDVMNVNRGVAKN